MNYFKIPENQIYAVEIEKKSTDINEQLIKFKVKNTDLLSKKDEDLLIGINNNNKSTSFPIFLTEKPWGVYVGIVEKMILYIFMKVLISLK